MNDSAFEHVSCNLCGADQPVIIYKSNRNSSIKLKSNEFRSSGDEPLKDPLVKCKVCGFKYVTPRLDSAMVLNEYTNSVDETFVSQAKGRELTFKHCLAYIREIWKKTPGRILDVGTANGSFLKVAKEAGWDVVGCEPNRWMCEWCKTNYGINIIQGTIFDSGFDNEDFDIVTLWDVLEHTPDPMATLRECVRVLRPGGLLVVNYPDIGSWIAKIMGRKWVFLLSVHYYYFTKDTIWQAIERAGLSKVIVKPHIQNLEFDYILFRSIPYLGLAGKIFRSLIKLSGLSTIQIPYWMGQTLVIAKKFEKPVLIESK